MAEGVRLGVLASGAGTILESLADADLPIVVVLVDRPCGAVDVATHRGIPVETVERSAYLPDRLAFTEAVVDRLRAHAVDVVAMAGFMTILDKPIFDRFDGRVLNTHPSLLPAFRGAHAVADALAAGVRVTGCTIHVATVEVDDGPILAQEAVPVELGDTVATLHERVKEVERRLYPAVLRAVVDGTITL